MSSRIRGQEAVIQFSLSDEHAAAFGLGGKMTGSFTKVKDFVVTTRSDIMEENYIGEQFTDLDFQLHGFDMSFTVDELDASCIQFMNLVMYNEENHLAPPEITIAVTYVYRNGVTRPQTEIYSECILKRNDRSIGGRTENISNSFEAKAKRCSVQVG